MGAHAGARDAAGGVWGARCAARRHLMKMEWADLLIIVVWVSLVLASVVAFIWQIYRRGIWGMFKFEPDERYQQFLQRVQRAWERRSDRRGPKAK